MINIQNIHKLFKCFKLYLHPANHNPRSIRKVDKDCTGEIVFEDMKFPVKVRDIHKIEGKKKKIFIGFCVFGYENKEQYPIMC